MQVNETERWSKGKNIIYKSDVSSVWKVKNYKKIYCSKIDRYIVHFLKVHLSDLYM